MIKDIEEVKKMLEHAKANSLYDSFPLSKEEQAIEYLLSLVKKQRSALESIIREKYHPQASYTASQALKEE